MTMANKTDFRGSEVTDYLRCRKRYQYAWVQNLEPKQKNDKLTVGSAIHKFLELWYSEHRAGEAMEAMEQYITDNSMGMDEIQYEFLKELARQVCAHYIQNYGMDDKWTVKAVEMPFNIHLEGRINYIGTIDMLIEDNNGKLWIVDHKTTNSLEIYDKNSDMDRQISRYWYAIERYLNVKIEGFIYNIILKDYPIEPKLLKSGALSKDKSQRTTLQLYRAAIEYHGLNEEDYKDFLQYLEDQPKEFFRRIKVERNISEMREAISELTDVIYDIRDSKRYYRNITKDCHWDCAFKSLCIAEMDGSNADHIRNELFKVKDDAE